MADVTIQSNKIVLRSLRQLSTSRASVWKKANELFGQPNKMHRSCIQFNELFPFHWIYWLTKLYRFQVHELYNTSPVRCIVCWQMYILVYLYPRKHRIFLAPEKVSFCLFPIIFFHNPSAKQLFCDSYNYG